jgi:hypothetical protein
MVQHAITDKSRTDVKDGIGHLSRIWQCVCKVAGQLKNKFCPVWKEVTINFRITFLYLGEGQKPQI